MKIVGKDNEFARHSLLVRIPQILTQCINQLYVGKHSKQIEQLGKLIYDLKRNKALDLFEDELPDYEDWKRALMEQKDGKELLYFDCPWLFSECYIYRRLQSIVSDISIDVFKQEKMKALQFTIESFQLPLTMAKKEGLFARLLGSLWGNQMDLSLHVNMGNMPIHDLDLDKLILNDFEELWKTIQHIDNGTIVIVLDNVASEFINDLFLADFLIENQFAKTIIFHCKAMPWFVSDVTLSDVKDTMDALESSPDLKKYALKWKTWTNDKFIFKKDYYWTLPYCFNEIEQQNKFLYQELHSADLVIFKGDLNYRKLTQDQLSDTIEISMGYNTLAIRTCKSDTLLGVSKEKRNQLDKIDEKWRVNGKYGIIQFLK